MRASIGFFVLGLTCIAVTALLAYISMAADAGAVEAMEERTKLRLNRELAIEKDRPDFDTSMEIQEEFRGKRYRAAGRLAAWGLALGIASLVSFVVGAIFAALVLRAAPGTAALDVFRTFA